MTDDMVSETIRIARPPRAVYDTVTRVADMGRWSPECTGGEVKGGVATEIRAGTRFTGHNRSDRRPWSTACTVTAADPGERFTFVVRAAGLRIAVWSYRFEPLDEGRATQVTETWIDQRGGLMRLISPVVSGVRDRAEFNRRGMRQTLQRLKEALEEEHRTV
ncbi:SRPBCC family protein [Streptomyces coffeae]|uniref:SRPBCC family protein n=1 Tax=Streptomyces coffeae TaxID=621382 RepID=A0ABS1NPD4_9ACTN|nr:SRPBCC family protein [Streptomyces coffeae]MBL1101952.1 SRPBCC family protein [Streptomyces coffeae]